MPEIRPFRGIRYDVDRVGRMGNVVSPPYDVIDDALRETLYGAHDQNVVRIIQGREEPGDSATVNRYARAAAAYRDWLSKGVLRRDDEEGIYLTVQEFDAKTAAGPVRKSRMGIVALVRIEAFGEGAIHPHEHTMPGPKADRLELMRHTTAAFGQIFSLYSDPEGILIRLLERHLATEPAFEFEDLESVRHRFWRVGDRETVNEVAAFLKQRPLFIADGHHRYETAVVYRDERVSDEGGGPGERSYGYRMQTMVNMDDEGGMAIYPIHRVVVDLGRDGLERLKRGVRELFDAEEAPVESVEQVAREVQRRTEGGRMVFGFCAGNLSPVQYLTLKSSVDPGAIDREAHSDAWRGLSTGLLQVVLGHVLDLDTDTLIRGEKVRFVKVGPEVETLMVESPDRAAFVLGPVGMEALREVVLAGERMPPKSTFFYPKVYTGLVMQDLDAF